MIHTASNRHWGVANGVYKNAYKSLFEEIIIPKMLKWK